MEVVRKHTEEKWVILYIERFLKASIEMPDGTTISRNSGVLQGGLCLARHNEPCGLDVMPRYSLLA